MIAALGLVCMLAGPASALSITTRNASGMIVSGTNNTIMNGENISINVTGMSNGTFFQWNVTNHQDMSSFIHASGNTNTSAFGNFNITIPFTISKAAFNMSEINTTENTMIVGNYENDPAGITPAGQYHELVYNGSSVNGLFSRTNKLDIVQGNMSTRWVATPMTGARYVTNAFTINGTKVAGPETFDMNTSMYTENPATVNVEISANGTLAYNETFSIISNETLQNSSVSGSDPLTSGATGALSSTKNSSALGSDPLTGWLTSFWQWVNGQ